MSSRLFDEARRLISRAVIEALLPDGQWRSDGDYWVRSPLRADSNIGSFHITAEGLWKDFATDEGGDLIQLIQKMRGCSNVEAAEEIIRLGGGSPPERRSDRPAPARNREKVKPVVPVPAEALASLNAYIRSEYAIQHYGEAILGSKYCNAEGRVLFAVCRYERAGAHKQKSIRPYYYGVDGKWHEGQAMEHDRPVLHLPEMLAAPALPVLVVEGEKCAAVEVPGYVVVTWVGGSSAVTHTDWGPLAERDVVIWPDYDGPGYKAGNAIKKRLQHARLLKIDGKPAGWDIADAQADGLDLAQFLRECPDLETSTEEKKLPFALLGYDSARHWFLPRRIRVPYTIDKGHFSASQLLELAPLAWWGAMDLIKDTGAIRVDQAQDWLLGRYEEERIGMVDLRRLRGPGVWRDGKRILVNDGRKLVGIDGQESSYEQFSSAANAEYIPSETHFGDMTGEESSNEEGQALVDLFCSQRFTRKLDPVAVLGWALVAPFGGILSWRPHLWITGRKGTGKSTVLVEKLIDPILGEFAHCATGRASEPGLRRAAHLTARPIRLDEFDPKTKADAERMTRIIVLARNACNDSTAMTTLADGKSGTVTFIVRSCFCFVSVNMLDTDSAIESRIVRVEKVAVDDIGAEIARMRSACPRVMRDPSRYRRRIFRALPRILEDIEGAQKLLMSFLGDAREADVVAPLLCAAWAIRSRQSITTQAGTDWVAPLLDDLQAMHADRIEDEDRMMQHICSYKVRLEGGRERAIAELLGDMAMPSQASESGAEDILSRHGLRVKQYSNGTGHARQVLAVAIKADPVARMLEGTPYVQGYEAQLQRHPLHLGSENVRLRIGVHRCRLLDWEGFRRKYLDSGGQATLGLEEGL